MFIKANDYLYASYYCQDGRLRYPTGIKADSQNKGDKLKLDRIERLVTQYVANAQIQEQDILRHELTAYLDEQLEKSMKTKSDFKDDWDQMIKDMRSGALLKKDGNRFSEASAKNYGSVLTKLKNYEDATGFKFTYRFNIEDYRKFLQWLIKCNYSRNSIAEVVARLGAFLQKMYDAKKHKNKVYENPEFQYSWEESDTVALTLNELTTLYNMQLTGAKERARDVFVFGCWVALRAEDLNRINEYKRVGDKFEVLTSKTGEKVVIPVHWMADAIYTKYNGILPVYSTPEGLNYHLSDICKTAGITEQRLIAITKGGQRQAQYFAKNELVSIHTARRTFATLMYKEGFAVKAIMKITGHRTERAFFLYIKISKEEAADMMLQSAFFKKPS